MTFPEWKKDLEDLVEYGENNFTLDVVFGILLSIASRVLKALREVADTPALKTLDEAMDVYLDQ